MHCLNFIKFCFHFPFCFTLAFSITCSRTDLWIGRGLPSGPDASGPGSENLTNATNGNEVIFVDILTIPHLRLLKIGIFSNNFFSVNVSMFTETNPSLMYQHLLFKLFYQQTSWSSRCGPSIKDRVGIGRYLQNDQLTLSLKTPINNGSKNLVLKKSAKRKQKTKICTSC